MDFLTQLQSHHSFQRLSAEEKLLFGELVVSAENDELKEFIDRAGVDNVLKLMDHMSQYDAELFAAYLAEHSNYTHHAHGHDDVINKRDSDNDHHSDDHHHNLWYYLTQHTSYYSHLPAEEEATFNALKQAAEDHTLTSYIDQVGYGAVFGLLEHLDSSHSDEVNRMIQNALAAEASSSVQVNKRQGHSAEHHSNFFNYVSSLRTQYYENLPEEEQKTYHDLLSAAQSKTLTAYIDQNGYGAIFGFIEHLDYWHASEVYNYLEAALAAEAAAAPTA